MNECAGDNGDRWLGQESLVSDLTQGEEQSPVLEEIRQEQTAQEHPWAIYIKEMLEKSSTSEPDVPSTFFCKVPLGMREAKPDAYIPKCFTFGPYHGKLEPSKQDRSKAFALSLLEEGEFWSLVEKIQSVEAEVRALYVAGPEIQLLQSQALACLLALDAVSTVTGFLYHYYHDHLRFVFHDDSILMENQIPLLVIKYAIEIAWKLDLGRDGSGALESLVNDFVSMYSPFCEREEAVVACINCGGQHFAGVRILANLVHYEILLSSINWSVHIRIVYVDVHLIFYNTQVFPK